MTETLMTVLVIRHDQGISPEGAIHQRNQADKAIADLGGMEVVGAVTGVGDAAGEAIRILTSGFGDG